MSSATGAVGHADHKALEARLAAAEEELASLAYAVSHDLRSPLRAIAGFGEALLEDHRADLKPDAIDCLERIREAAAQMNLYIDRLVELARISRSDLRVEEVDVTAIADEIARKLESGEPSRNVRFEIARGLSARGDYALLAAALQHLLDNAWKFTGRRDRARIAVGREEQAGGTVLYVKDDGAGFDPAHASRLFGAFQRLHRPSDFPGLGTGLAAVRRIVHRHGGRVWAVGGIDQGATIYIDLP
jgi:light-regulated signal transduction histidine kinase (bacteriophytochrome)